MQRAHRSSLDCQAGSNGKHNAPERRVVVTGMGVVSALGHEVEDFYDKLLQVSAVMRASDCCSLHLCGHVHETAPVLPDVMAHPAHLSVSPSHDT